MPIDPKGRGDDTWAVAADEPHGVLEMRWFASDLPIRPPEIFAPRRAKRLARRFGFLQPFVNGAVAAHLARSQIAQSDGEPECRVARHDAADADFEVIRVRTEDEEINRHDA
jgi:hypothetical protein